MPARLPPVPADLGGGPQRRGRWRVACAAARRPFLREACSGQEAGILRLETGRRAFLDRFSESGIAVLWRPVINRYMLQHIRHEPQHVGLRIHAAQSFRRIPSTLVAISIVKLRYSRDVLDRFGVRLPRLAVSGVRHHEALALSARLRRDQWNRRLLRRHHSRQHGRRALVRALPRPRRRSRAQRFGHLRIPGRAVRWTGCCARTAAIGASAGKSSRPSPSSAEFSPLFSSRSARKISASLPTASRKKKFRPAGAVASYHAVPASSSPAMNGPRPKPIAPARIG